MGIGCTPTGYQRGIARIDGVTGGVDSRDMGIAVLGPLQVDGQSNGLSPRDRVVLSALLVRAGDPSSTDALADVLWGTHPPASSAKVVHGCIARLRKRLGGAAIESAAGGYLLKVNDTEIDSHRFERLFERARETLVGGDPQRAVHLVREALDLWRGRALADLEDWDPGRAEAARLEGLRHDAEELLVEAETLAGRARDVVELARGLVAAAPFRERRWALLAVALHQTGRQAEALAALKRARAMLVDQLGLDPGGELVDLEKQLLRHDPALSPALAREVSGTCPYRGLLPYDADDADSYFGREADVEACLRRLRDSRVLAVVGPSGIGKSSLVRAGVVASLVRSGTPVVVTSPGVRPTESLLGVKPRHTLVVDQAEEALTVCADAAETETYFAALAAHAAGGGSLVLSMRTDHLGDLAPYPEMAWLLQEGFYLLGPMSEPDLRSAIEGPALRAGLRLEPGLVDLLVREVEGEPAALPMLSHVLRAIWERREGPTLTVEGYRATGGIRSAVSQTAERLYDAMDASQRDRFRTLLLRLVMPTGDGDPVRARVPRSKVAADDEQQRLVEQLVDARLVSIDGDSVQIAHEALVRVWPRLRGWLDDDIEGQRLFQHLAGAADAWDGMGRPESELYRGARLARTLEWQDRAGPDLNDIESAFLDAAAALTDSEVRAAEERLNEQRLANRRLRGSLVGACVLLVIALVAGLVAIRSADRAGRDRDRAELAADLAQARRASAKGVVHEDIATGLLLAVEGVKDDPSAEALENLGATLTRAGALSGIRDLGEETGRPGTAWMPTISASAQGDLIAGNILGDQARLFDASTLEPRAFPDAPVDALSLALAPDGSRLVVATSYEEDQPLRLYDLPEGTLSEVQPGGLPASSGLNPYERHDADPAFSRDGSRLVAELQHFNPEPPGFSAWGRTLVWDVADPSEPVFSLRLPAFAQSALSPDGDRLYVATRGERPIRAYDVASGDLVAAAHSQVITRHGATAVDVSTDGSIFAVAVQNQVHRYVADDLRPAGPALVGHTELVHDVVFSHDGRLLATASIDGSTNVRDARTGDLLHRYVGGGLSVAFSADDRTVFTSGSAGVIQAWDIPGITRQLALGEVTSAVAKRYALSLVAPDGHNVARVRSGRLWIEDTRTGRAVGNAVLTRDEDFLWSPDSRWLLSVGSNGVDPGGVVTVWDASDGSVAARGGFEGEAVAATFGQNGDVVHVSAANLLHTLTAESLSPLNAAVPTEGDRPWALVAHPRDGSVFVLDWDGSFVRMDPTSGAVIASEPDGFLSDSDQEGVVSPDGNRMVVTGPDLQVRLLDAESHEYVDLDVNTPWGNRPAFSPDGSQFALVQGERILVWDGRTGEYQASLPLPTRTGAYSITYRDRTGVIVASTDGRTWTADTRTNTWAERACTIAGRNLTLDEWAQFFPGRTYESTCPQWPAAG